MAIESNIIRYINDLYKYRTNINTKYILLLYLLLKFDIIFNKVISESFQNCLGIRSLLFCITNIFLVINNVMLSHAFKTFHLIL